MIYGKTLYMILISFMENPKMTFKNWLRPSIQQPRYIANMVKAIFKPSLETQKIIQEYWDTWNKVYKPESIKDVNK